LWGRDPAVLMNDPTVWPAWIHPEDRGSVMAMVTSSIGSGEYGSDFRIVHPDGSVVWLHAKSFEVTDPAGGPSYTLGFHTDITLAKTVEEELRDKNQALQRSNAELEAFAYVASHDLREPLRNVTSFSTLLARSLEGKLNDDERDYIKIVTDAANRMDSLVRDLLEVSRVGRSERAMVPVPLNELAESARNGLRSQMQAADARIEIASPLPMVMGNDDELYRVLLNLLGNALKYHGPEPVRIVLDCRADGPEMWRFTVADNGIGLETGKGYEERIFGLFQRLHQRDEYGGGTGIGLPVCRKIIERHGGRIWAESEGQGLGTRIVFTLPKLPD
jgi:light-regulated signal transduction histidine kinase (bacteriophytochrome)